MHTKTVPALVGLLVLLLALAGELSMQLYVPALAEVAHAFGSDAATVQASLWVFLLGFGAGQLIFGPASDRFGRRPVLIIGLLLYLGATLAILSVASMAGFTAARLVQALGACASFVVARAIVRDLYPLERVPAVLATITLAVALSVALAPTVGGWLTGRWGWQASFVFLAALGSFLLLGALFFLKESNTQRSATPLSMAALAGSYAQLLRAPVFLCHALPLGFVYGAMMAYVCAAPFVVRDLLGITTQTLGLIFGGILSGFIIGILLSRLLVKRLGPDRLLSIGAALVLTFAAVTATALIVWGFDLRSVVVPQVLLTLGAGLILPNAVAGAITPYGARAGLAAALVGFLQMAAGAAFGMLAGVLHDGSPQPMLALQLTAAVVAFGLFKGLHAPAPAPVNAGPA